MSIVNHTVYKFDDLESLSRYAAAMFAGLSEESISETGRFAAALAGGSTPQLLYSILGSDAYRTRIPWGAVHFFWGDERIVPRSHKDSNYLHIYDNLLSKVPVPSGNIHPVDVGTDSPTVSSVLYEREIREFFGIKDDRMPRFDLIILGIGKDGHTASLFPGHEALGEQSHLAAAVANAPLHSRVTITLPVINNARNVLFLVSGEEKALILKRVLEEQDLSLPASLVRPNNGRVIFLVDRKAASLLSTK
ncbi:MAG TPA: 6-phosphogluconolactonase [Thermodesulfovibrionales bacterium]|nr:6-phosphogluconolactonase [Thermodesulfovibrionales bacterium]